MSAYESSTDRGFLLESREWQAIGGATGLMLLNVMVMYVAAATPLAGVNRLLFSIPVVGAVVYGLFIFAGEKLAERGIEGDSFGLAVAGVAVLELAFGAFGGGVLSFLGPSLRPTALAVTAVVTVLMTAGIGTYVYARSADFDHYGTWASYAFIGGLIALLVGSFVPVVLLVGFVLIFTGFILRLGHEMWRIRENRGRAVSMQAIGLYIAVAGVFVHVLQIAVRMLADR